jgi:signal transduction histidine kinase
MRVLSSGGSEPAGVRPVDVTLSTASGPLVISATTRAAVSGRAETLLGLSGLAFALLAAAVLVRRPGAQAARWFALFAALAAVALGVAPAAGGPHPAWALSAQFLSMLGLAATLPAFAVAFVGSRRPPRALRVLWTAAAVLLAAYLFAVAVHPAVYAWLRVVFGAYLTFSVLAAIGLLARRAAAGDDASVHDARLALAGIACGTLPFLVLTLIPVLAGSREIFPSYVTASLAGLIPAAFAYAILRHQLLGIRRLVHRGMVYGITAYVLLIVLALMVNGARLYLGASSSSATTVGLVVVAAVMFEYVRRAARHVIDSRIYRDEIDSQALLAGMRRDLLENDRTERVAEAIVERLRQALGLEGAALLLGTSAASVRTAAAAGPRAEAALRFVRPGLADLTFGKDGLAELWWDSDIVVVARLQSSHQILGYLVAGPKEKGEILVHEERLVVATVAPILALAIRETSLLTELREVSERLIGAEESERARIARDLHDGPLQKAIYLGGLLRPAPGAGPDAAGLAGDLVAELRDLCARLRPAILDDLSLVPAIDWLLDQASRQFAVRPSLTLRGMTEDDRFPPEAEVALFRVTQEAVSNAVRHGGAHAIRVSLARDAERLELCITDDGRGFSVSEGIPRGLGIPGMRERLRQVGGGVTVASDSGRGTVVTAFIPAAEARP